MRYGVLAFLAAMTFVLYLDRACINQAAPIIKKELGITETQKAIDLRMRSPWLTRSSRSRPAGGATATARGGILTRIVLWWSFFTALTGAAWGFGIAPRRSIPVRGRRGGGVAELGAGLARVVSRSSRGRAQGIVTTAMMLGGAAAPLASQWLIDRVGWRWSFAVFALIGVGWAIAFYLWFRDDPAEHPAVNEAERRLIAEGNKPPNSPVVVEDSLTPRCRRR